MKIKKPPTKLAFDLFCGLGGWTEAFLDNGFRMIGFDIEAHNYGNGGYPGELILGDVRQINGRDLVAKYGVPNCIVASPPCQEFSYMAMPWKLAKEKQRKIEADPKEQERLTDLFRQCFRIQREVSEAASHYVPMVVENVRGAQHWVGKAKWNFGSFYLWGDVPALMPIPGKVAKVPGFRFDGNGKSFQSAAVNLIAADGFKTAGMNWSDQTNPGNGTRFTSRDCGIEGVKGFTPNGQPLGKNRLARYGSKSNKRKQASAEIAKIPRALADWIAKCYSPTPSTKK